MMRIRSRTAAWAFAATIAFVAVAASLADSGDPEVPPVENTVKLDVQIAGLGAKGCKIEIKPAHPGCQFKPYEKTIEKPATNGVVKLELLVAAKSTGADRDCSFEIVVTEPGQKSKTFHRGLQLTPPAPGVKAPVRTLRCHLLATTVASKDEDAKTKRR